ncbi:MAG: MFS transporter [Promethearchaeota archaeon]|nr:MAG: MFS transporter [Candidatus Lokiarchaeota archaeon]
MEIYKTTTIKHPILIEIIIYLLFWLGPLTGNVILVLFGVLSTEFSVSPTEILIAIPSFMFPFAFVQLFSGAISDVKGRFSVILFGLVIFGCGTVIAIFSSSLTSYAIANILGGFGFGFVNPVLIALLTDITPEPNVSKKVGLLVAIANLGVGLGPIIAGQIVLINWRYLYILFIIITLMAFGLFYYLRQPTTDKSQSKTISLFFQQLSREMQRFVVILMILSAFLASQTYLAAIIWTSRTFTGVVPENLSGIIIGFAGIFGAISSVTIGFLIKKYGILIAIFIGIGSLFIALILLLSLSDITTMDVLIFDAIAYMLLGTSGGALISTVMYCSQIISKESRGTLAGLATFGQFIGNALIPITYDYIFHYGGIRAVYYVVIIVMFLLIGILGLLYNSSRQK